MTIKEQFEQTEKLYHFTSFDTALKIIESNRLRFGRLNSMNDIHENDKIVFANYKSSDKFPSDILDALHDEIYRYRQISLTADSRDGGKNGFDLHQMWGLYANKGEGVCLVLDKKELEKEFNKEIINGWVSYGETVKSFYASFSDKPSEIAREVKEHANEIFFHKRKEWEHEQEYRLLKRCPNTIKEEYFLLRHALKFVILSSKLRNIDEVLYFKKIIEIKEKVEKVKNARNIGKSGRIPVLIYGNGFFDYALGTEDGEEEIWNSNDGYDILVIGKNCELAL